MIFGGIDAGSRAIKIVLIDSESQSIVASGITDQGVEQVTLARQLLETLLEEQNISPKDLGKVVATGYGRNMLSFADATITEITCHAVGVRRLIPNVMSIIEIGGQDSKVIRLNPRGNVQDFAMNDRCAAGTGRFLEVVAQRLGLKLVQLGEMAAVSTRPASISSMCVVFAETEIIGLLASGTSPADIVAGVQLSLASRISALAGRSLEPPIVFTGGVALIPGMTEALGSVLKQPLIVAPDPQMTGALGAAILAARQE